jgi:hypothetical protein
MKKAEDIIDQVRAAIAKWPLHADQAGVSSASEKMIRAAIHKVEK